MGQLQDKIGELKDDIQEAKGENVKLKAGLEKEIQRNKEVEVSSFISIPTCIEPMFFLRLVLFFGLFLGREFYELKSELKIRKSEDCLLLSPDMRLNSTLATGS